MNQEQGKARSLLNSIGEEPSSESVFDKQFAQAVQDAKAQAGTSQEMSDFTPVDMKLEPEPVVLDLNGTQLKCLIQDYAEKCIKEELKLAFTKLI